MGVLSEPRAGSESPCLILLNAGLVYRVGPARLSVELARRAADAGFPSLRFDFSGIGDSAPPPPSVAPTESAIADVREAMDHVGGAHGIRRFVILGLCSGALYAHHAAADDDRIVGAALLDGYVYLDLPALIRLGARRLSDPGKLLRGVRRRAAQGLLRANRSSIAQEDEGFLPGWPPKSRARRDLQRMCDRDVQLLYVYSGEWRWYRYEGQIRDAFRGVDFGDRLTERRIPLAEHLYFTRPEREEMFAIVLRWLAERFPAPPG